jgi:F-type H+-transporting ATPase subunit epsilon
MIAATELRLVLVTPETTLRDEPVRSLRFPLFDGQIGVLPGRAPLVGRLGAGELKFITDSGTERFFIDGGFVQIKGSVVTLLTDRALPAAKIDVAQQERELEEASALVPTDEAAFAEKQKRLDRARSMIAMGRRRS